MPKNNYFFVKTKYDYISTVSMWSLCGSNNDPRGKEGISHFFEHLFLNRTNKLPNKISVLRKIDSLGLFFNAYTRKNYIYYYFIQRVREQDAACEMLIKGLKEFNVSDDDINREKEVIINEQKQHHETPSAYLWNLADKGLWPNTPLSSSALGKEESIRSITRDDIYRQKDIIFGKSNLGFLTISSKGISTSYEKEFNRLTGEEDDSPPKLYTDNEYQRSDNLICDFRNSSLVYLAISFPLPRLEEVLPSKVALDFIKNYLASGWSSKLIEKLRLEKNFTYWVYGGIELYDNAGYFRISLSSERKNVVEVIKIITNEIQKLQQNLINDEELLNHKTAMKAHLLKHHIQPENMLWWYGWNIFAANRQYTINDYFRSIDALSTKEIYETATKYLSIEKIHIAALGNIHESDFRL